MKRKYKKVFGMALLFQIVFLCFYVFFYSEKLSEKRVYEDKILKHDGTFDGFIAGKNHGKPITQRQENITSTSKRQTKKKCIGNSIQLPSLQNYSWSAVAGTNNVYIFSAYMVGSAKEITLIGASAGSNTALYCQYWHVSQDNLNRQLEAKQASIRLLPESHGHRYSGALFKCPPTSFGVNYVSLATKQCSVPLNLLLIHNASIPQYYKHKFTVCLKPLHFEYGRAYELVEWIELNRIIGAEKFIIYNYSSADNVNDVLKHYVKQDIVELVQWNLPIRSYTWPRKKGSVEIHSIGMLPMLQDCLFRSKQHSEFVVNIDVDEFIIPQSNNVTTWPEMLTQLNTQADTYFFRNTFFRKEWNNSKIEFPGKKIAEKLKLVTLEIFEREAKILPPRSRSKYFTRTTKQNILTIHDVSGSSHTTVPVDVCLLYHYRNWQSYNDNTKRVEDYTVLQKYGKKLIKQVDRVWKELVNVKMDITK